MRAQHSLMRMTFGKHSGRLVTALPSSYIAWLLREVTFIDEELEKAVEAEAEERCIDPHDRSTYTDDGSDGYDERPDW